MADTFLSLFEKESNMDKRVKLMSVIWTVLGAFTFISSFFLPILFLKIGVWLFSLINCFAAIGMFYLLKNNEIKEDNYVQLQDTEIPISAATAEAKRSKSQKRTK